MKVVTFITSSNRNGNEKTIVDRLTVGIQDNEGSNEILFMDDFNIEYCTGCRSCMDGGGCVLNDDFNMIMDKIREADYFIFAAPIFFNDIAGHAKMFLDRFGSLGSDPELEMKEKKSLLLITHFSDDIHPFVIENIHRGIVSANFKVNKILDIGGLLTKKFDEFELEEFEDIGYELEEYEIIPHKLDLDSATV
jgi:multimeric flavodoxin WrbA